MEEKPGPTNKISIAHQIITLAGIPTILGVAAWFAIQFNEMQLANTETKKDINYLQKDVAELKDNFKSVFGYSLRQQSNTFAGSSK